MTPSTSQVLTDWSPDPSIILGLLALIAAYVYGIGPLRRRYSLGPPATAKQILYFATSVALVAFALMSPLDEIGDRYLFTAHMVQHLLLAALFPPIFLLGIPAWLVAPVFRHATVGGIAAVLTRPAVALILFNANIYVWHIPVLYDATLQNIYIHIIEHLTFMVTGVINWWPVLSPIRSQRLPYPGQMLYLFAEGTLMMVLAIVFTFSPFSYYPPYANAPRLWGFTAVNDQQVGGLVMWYPGNVPYAYLLVVAFYRWFGDQDPAYEYRNPAHESNADFTPDSIAYNESPHITETGARRS